MKSQSVFRRLGNVLAAPLIAFIIALIASALALKVGGYSPAVAFKAMFNQVTTVESAAIIVNKAVPLFLSGLAVAIGFRMGLFNIGVEGQLQIAAAMAGVVGAAVHLPTPLHILLISLTAITVGALYAAIPGILKVTRNVNEVISTIMLNAIAISLIAWVSKTGLFITTAFRQTRPLPKSAWFPKLNTPLSWIGIHLPAGTQLFGFTIIAIFIGIGFHIMLTKSRFGFDLKASGLNPVAARFSGVNSKKMIFTTMVISGAMAGAVGLPALLSEQHSYKIGEFPAGFGFGGIAVALLGRNSTPGIAFSALLFGLIERASLALQDKKIPREIGVIMQGIIILSAVVAYEVVKRRNEAAAIRDASEQAAKAHAQVTEATA